MWKLAFDCKEAHAFGEDGWRPANEPYHEHWEPHLIYVLIQYWDEDKVILGIFPSTEKLFQHIKTLKASGHCEIEWQEWDLDDVCTQPKRRGTLTQKSSFTLPKELQ